MAKTLSYKDFEEGNLLQSPEWGKMNELIGHKAISLNLDGVACQMIIKDARRGRFLEIPGGPLLDWHNRKLVAKTFAKIKEIAKEQRCVFVRFRPQLADTPENRVKMAQFGARPAPMHLGAQNTIIIDLTKTEDELLANMRRQTRYEVRKADKLGIKTESGTADDLFKEFHQVQAKTAEIQHFFPPDEKELLAEHEAFGKNAVIFTAKSAEGKPIAYGLILKAGQEADYFEAASTELHYELPGAYALQWAVMKSLKKEGFKRYNLWGIAPEGQPYHRYAKVTTFKRGFGGEIVNFVPAHDLVINPVKYSLNYTIETIRKKRRHLS